MSNNVEKKKQNLFIILTAIFLTNAVLAEMIGNKIFSFEETVGLTPNTINIFGFYPSFNLTAGVVIWPVVFIFTDIANEYFGKRGVRKMSLLAVGMITYSFFVIWIVSGLSPAEFWLNVNATDDAGNPFNVNFAFNKIFIQSNRIIVGSLVAFMVGQLLDVLVFQKLRKLANGKMIWLRATGSTLISQLVDSFVVLFLAFYFLAPSGTSWSVGQVLSVGTSNYIYKFVVALSITPLIYLAHWVIDRYLGDAAEQIKEEASSQGFL
ncbi:MAG: queuosine precursor transporter [Cytophagales bacterium]|nr:queuosine precursor transporter [Cytophagales bacterium]